MTNKIMMKETFIIKIIDTQNASWQGTISWTNGKAETPFRSALELMKLIDSAIVKENE